MNKNHFKSTFQELHPFIILFVVLVIIFTIQNLVTRSSAHTYTQNISDQKILLTQLQLSLLHAEQLSTDAFEFNLKREAIREQLKNTQQLIIEKSNLELKYPFLRSSVLYLRSLAVNKDMRELQHLLIPMFQDFEECQQKLSPVLSYNPPESSGLPDWEETDKYYFDWTEESLAYLYAQANTGQIYENARDKIRSVEYLLKQPRSQDQVSRNILEQLNIESMDAKNYAWQYCQEVITQHHSEGRQQLTSSIIENDKWESRLR